MYTGDLLPRDRYEEWAEERRAGLRQKYLTLLSELAAIYEGRGDFDRAIETGLGRTTRWPATAPAAPWTTASTLTARS